MNYLVIAYIETETSVTNKVIAKCETKEIAESYIKSINNDLITYIYIVENYKK